MRLRHRVTAIFFASLLLVTNWQVPTVHAAIAADATSNASAQDNTLVTSLTWSHTTSGSNRCLIVTVAMNDTTDLDRVVQSVTYNAVGASLIKRQNDDAGNKTVEMWGLIAPATGANNIIVTLNAGTVSQLSAGALSLTGCDQTAPFEATNGVLQDNDSTPTVTVTPLTDQAFVVDGWMRSTEVGTPVAGASQTEYFRYATSASMSGGGSYKGPVGTSLQTMTWDSSGSNLDDYVMAVVSVKPAAGGGGGSPAATDQSYGIPLPILL